ncbi:MAG: histidine kinase [Verrucomicrobiota bacterium]
MRIIAAIVCTLVTFSANAEPSVARFQVGDDPRWAAPDFDDQNWMEAAMPGSWQSQNLANTGNTCWYRFKVETPSRWDGAAPLSFSPGIVGNLYEVYWNGELIGRKGSFDPYLDLPRTNAYRIFEVPRQLLRTDEPNLIALRVHNYWSKGGILSERPSLAAPAELLARKAQIERLPTIGLICTVVVLGIIFFIAIALAVWQYRLPLVWAFLFVIAAQFIWEFLRAGVLLGDDQWMAPPLYLGASVVYYAGGSIGGLMCILLLLRGSVAKWYRNYAIISGAIIVVVTLTSVQWRAAEVLAYSIGILWFLSYLIVIGNVIFRALKERRPFARPAAILVGLTALFSFLDSVSYITPVLPGATAWVDMTSWFIILSSSALGVIVIAWLIRYKSRAEMLASQVLSAEIDERSRLARELHDGVAQTLLAVKMNVETQHGAGDIDVEQLLVQLDSASDELREAAHDIHPAVLGSRSLEDAFRVHAGSLGPERIEFEIEKAKTAEPQAETRHHLFRVFQELLGNAVKHGAEGSVKVRWSRDHSNYVLEVENPLKKEDKRTTNPGLGSQSLAERLEILGGQISTKEFGDRFLARVEIPASRWK